MRKAGQVIGCVAFFALLLGVWLLLFAVPGGHSKESAKRAMCLSNVKQLASALLMYQEDHGRLPHRDAWMSAAEKLVESGFETGFRCPVVFREGYGYAFNSRLDRKDINTLVGPGSVPIVYESISLARNASDPVASLPNPARHDGGNAIAFADGSVRRVMPLAKQ